MKRNTAFTLIELLVVVTIITLLVALLLPALGRAKFAAETVLCASRIRQSAMGVQSYCYDYRGYFPYINQPTINYDYGRWAAKVAPYVGYTNVTPDMNVHAAEYAVLQCPSVVTGIWTYGYPHWLYAINWDLQKSPAIFPYPTAGHPDPWNLEGANEPQKIEKLKNHSKIGVLMDSGATETCIYPYAIDEYGIVGHSSPGVADPNHQGRGIGVGHLDGHAVFVSIQQPYTAPAVDRPIWWYRSYWGVPGQWGIADAYCYPD